MTRDVLREILAQFDEQVEATRRHFERQAAENKRFFEEQAAGIQLFFDEQSVQSLRHFGVVAEGLSMNIQRSAEGQGVLTE